VLAAGQPVDPEDFNYVNEKLDPIFRKLAGLEIVYVADPDNIPGVWFSDLADIVAGECATKFGIAGEEYVDMVNKGLGGAGRRDRRGHGGKVAQDHRARPADL
jgi:hypothetical protein